MQAQVVSPPSRPVLPRAPIGAVVHRERWDTAAISASASCIGIARGVGRRASRPRGEAVRRVPFRRVATCPSSFNSPDAGIFHLQRAGTAPARQWRRCVESRVAL